MESMPTSSKDEVKHKVEVSEGDIVVEKVGETRMAKARRIFLGNLGFFLTALLSVVLLCALITLFVQAGKKTIPFTVQPNTSTTDMEHKNSIIVFDPTSGGELTAFTAQRIVDSPTAWFDISVAQPPGPMGIEGHGS
eukprot:gnl/Chilomastix_caulleri/1868.p1 GENE.gnl/Chilomastix_caulleri/1868~~gnl/Chilomastix_caulleri/1868.p1  ORF type:complete len:137 (-),score=38.24 gnl/Chilomastix_caulleri/1868:138-548(-)